MSAQDPDGALGNEPVKSRSSHAEEPVTTTKLERGDYVLGTHDAEIARLGLQHRAWREAALGAWRRAGLTAGMRVMDVGAGPGYAALDLCDLVGTGGEVVAVERSPRFAAFLRQEKERLDLPQLRVLEGDLMELAPLPGYDLAWCRWVASFTPSVPALLRWIASSLKPGGRMVFHEYADYASWRFAPPRARLERFIAEVMASWRASGGEPDVAPAVIAALQAEGCTVRDARPLVFATRPGELTWQWPTSFIEINLERLTELGRITPAWADEVRTELNETQAQPDGFMITPLVLEIQAEKGP